jgi:gas vesicle protein
MSRDNRNLIIGIIAGVAVGGLAAILLAPSAGRETRANLRRATTQAKQKAAELSAKGREYVESKRSQFQEAVEAGKEAAEEKRAELEMELKERAGAVTST